MRIYLETTMFNFPFVPDLPDYRHLKADTQKVFGLIRERKHEPYTSLLALQELRNTITGERRENMLYLIKEYHISVLALNDDVRRLAGLYVKEGAVPPWLSRRCTTPCLDYPQCAG
ncbi:PIN domain-containing protein [Breznakiellaceae bacterium SP9]